VCLCKNEVSSRCFSWRGKSYLSRKEGRRPVRWNCRCCPVKGSSCFLSTLFLWRCSVLALTLKVWKLWSSESNYQCWEVWKMGWKSHKPAWIWCLWTIQIKHRLYESFQVVGGNSGSGFCSFDTYFSSSLHIVIVAYRKCFIGCHSGSAEGGGKLEEGGAFSGLLDLWSPWIWPNDRNLGPWASAETQLSGCACWNIRVTWMGALFRGTDFDCAETPFLRFSKALQ